MKRTFGLFGSSGFRAKMAFAAAELNGGSGGTATKVNDLDAKHIDTAFVDSHEPQAATVAAIDDHVGTTI